MNEALISINRVRKSYGEQVVLSIDELNVERGTCFGLVGNNGAGKTTLFRAILDLIPLNEGDVRIADRKVNEDETWKKFTGAFLDEGFLMDYLRPEEFFYFIGSTKGMRRDEVDAALVEFASLFKDEILGKKRFIRDLSKGNQKKVGIAAAFLGFPELVILDEPFANLDPSSQFVLRDIIRKLVQERGVTTLISSHDLAHVAEICSRIVIVERGRLVKDLQTNSATLTELESFFQALQ